MDLSKAFGTINHDLLMAKLEAYVFLTVHSDIYLIIYKIDLKDLKSYS